MSGHKHTSAAIVLTVFALVLAMSSMTLPYYRVIDGVVDYEGRAHYYTIDFYPTYYDTSRGTGDYSSFQYEDVGSLFNMLYVLIWVWAFAAMFYILRILHVDESEFRWWQGGFIAGWVLVAVAVMPALVFALFIDSSIPVSGFIGSTTYDSWGPMSGWTLLVLACLIQVVAVLARNVPAIVRWWKGTDEVPPELAARGDLPLR